HWEAVKWVIRYVKSSLNARSIYLKGASNDNCLVGYAGADFAADLDKRRSTSEYVFTLFQNTISWKSSLQSVVALSTTESEYISLVEAVKEGIWLKGLVNELIGCDDIITVYSDSQSAIALSKNPLYHDRSKHIDIRFHYLREKVLANEISLEKIPSSENPADMLTKSLTSLRTAYLMNLLKVGVG
ncbi:MAG: Ty1/Copia family ribonuclease HI, partial [Sweet potato little leaf phytoplasma]|nr:Ty1/Copia family ribonuclease HI [Sweet potato little leaf phytoplasma]